MLVPRYWATHTAKYRQGRTRFAMLRFGWSQTSQQEAEDMARARAEQAVQERLAGGKPIGREHKVPYGGAEGLPIREEIVDTHGDIVITRNSYGARCMNVADVCFVDVDSEWKPERMEKTQLLGILAVMVISTVLLYFVVFKNLSPDNACCRAGTLSWGSISSWIGAIFVSAVIVTPVFLSVLTRILKSIQKITERDLMGWLAKLTDEEKTAGFRLYQTPLGFRIIATHKTFDPAGQEMAQLFKRLRADPVYALMCLRQKCFRARVSAKPWRIGISGHIRGHRATWPLSAEKLPARASWVQAYEEKAAQYCACRFLAAIGSAAMPLPVAAAVRLHDELCGALSGKPCA